MTTERREVLLLPGWKICWSVGGREVEGNEKGSFPPCLHMCAAVQGFFLLGVELTRALGLAPCWGQWSAAWAAATSRHCTVESSSPAVVVVTMSPFIFDLLKGGYSPFQL